MRPVGKSDFSASVLWPRHIMKLCSHNLLHIGSHRLIKKARITVHRFLFHTLCLFIILLVQFGLLSGHLLGNSCPLG